MPREQSRIHDEVLAVLAAHRELSADADEELANAFVARLERESLLQSSQSNLQARLTDLLARIPLTLGQVIWVAIIETLATLVVALIITQTLGVAEGTDWWVYPLWDALSLIWLLELVVTLGVLGWVQRPGRKT